MLLPQLLSSLGDDDGGEKKSERAREHLSPMPRFLYTNNPIS